MGGGGFLQDGANKQRELQRRRNEKSGFKWRSTKSGKLEIGQNVDQHSKLSEDEMLTFKSRLAKERKAVLKKNFLVLLGLIAALGMGFYLLMHLTA